MTTIEIKITALHMALGKIQTELSFMKDSLINPDQYEKNFSIDILLGNAEKIFNWLTLIETPKIPNSNLNNNLTAPPVGPGYFSTSTY